MECEGFIQTFLIGLFRGSCQGFDWMGSWGLSTFRVDDLPKVRFRFQVRSTTKGNIPNIQNIRQTSAQSNGDTYSGKEGLKSLMPSEQMINQ
jgi:hypothetical protein